MIISYLVNIHHTDFVRMWEKEIKARRCHRINLIRKRRTYKSQTLEGEIKVYRDAVCALSKSGKRTSLGIFTATAYDPVESCKPFDDGITAKLIPAGLGIAAVDPSIVPYGSVLYLPELNRYFFACDTGAAMKRNGGKNIDLLMPTVEAARKFGRQRLAVELIDLSEE